MAALRNLFGWYADWRILAKYWLRLLYHTIDLKFYDTYNIVGQQHGGQNLNTMGVHDV